MTPTAVPEVPSGPEPEDDRVYVRRALDGDERAFAVLVRRHERGIYNVAWRMVRDRELARDLTQEIFVRVYRSLGKYDPTYPFVSWLYRVASNLCIDWIRKKKLRTVSLDAPIGGEEDTGTRDVEDPAQDPARDLEQAERVRILEEALAKLPESHRLVLLLRHQRDLSYDEIATSLDIPLGTVKARIHRAREAFRKILVQDYGREDLE
ncbi:MAG: sigma-70 family RNA polymerase sigma factor [bacterium]